MKPDTRPAVERRPLNPNMRERLNTLIAETRPRPLKPKAERKPSLLEGYLNKPVLVRLVDGTEASGVLARIDTYELALNTAEGEVVLFKHACLTIREIAALY